MSSLIIGLTGGIGSGKTTVTDCFTKFGIDIVDADEVAREVVAPGSNALKQIAEHFGDIYIQKSGELDRSLLREKVFSDPAAKAWLNGLLHPLIRETMKRQLTRASSQYCILSAPLLLENNLEYLVDHILVIDVSIETQIERTTKRDASSDDVVKSIIASQISRNDRLHKADDVINNQDITLNQLQKITEKLHNKYLLMSKK